MKSSRFPLLLSMVSVLAFTAAHAQQVPVAPRLSPISPASAVPASDTLSTNYRITLAANVSGQKIGELSLLTAEPEIQVLGSLDENKVSSVTLRAALLEKEGRLTLRFGSLSAHVPIDREAKSAAAAPSGAPMAPQARRYQEISASGSILITPGRSYEVLKSESLTLLITVTPEPDK